MSESAEQGKGVLADFLNPRIERSKLKGRQQERVNAMLPVIHEVMRELGYDPDPDAKFIVAPTRIVDMVGAYGIYGSFNHWTRGENYWRMRQEREQGSIIYELVNNTKPATAYLAEGNKDDEQYVVVSHVDGHTDFFRHNYAFQNTDPHYAANVIAHARRIAEYEKEYGIPHVEEFIDAVETIDWNIDPDPNAPINRLTKDEYIAHQGQVVVVKDNIRRKTDYDDLFDLDEKKKEKPEPPKPQFPAVEEKGITRFIQMFSPRGFDKWEEDILDIKRKETEFFWAYASTKIMNEGWATRAHMDGMHKLHDIGKLPKESLDIVNESRMLAGVVHPHPHHPNPYQLGYEIYKDLQRRYEGKNRKDGRHDYDWKGDIIDYTKLTPEQRERYNPRYVMETYTDESFLREFLTPAIIEDLKLYQYALRYGQENDWNDDGGKHWRITTRDAKKIIDGLADSKINNGFPVIVIPPGGGDYNGRKELMLLHKRDDTKRENDIELKDAQKTLTRVYTLWGKPVHLDLWVTEEEEANPDRAWYEEPQLIYHRKHIILTCPDGESVERKVLSSEVVPQEEAA